MSRIAERFQRLAEAGRKGFIPFISAGDPDLETSGQILDELTAAGADIIELGVPFSDPMADGPTIQASSMRALAAGTTLPDILKMISDFRRKHSIPVVLFSYFNPLYRYGIERLAQDAADAGVDGILVTDAVDQEAEELSAALTARDIDLISLIAPTTNDDRLRSIAERASGFVYAVSRAGVTGTRSDTSSVAEHLVTRARRFTDLPIAVGFGISTPEQVEEVWRYADAAVVGSAIVAEIEHSITAGDSVQKVGEFVRRLVPAFAKGRAEI